MQYCIRPYCEAWHDQLIDFFQSCFPESERTLELKGRHAIYNDIAYSFEGFWCLFDGERLIGTAGFRRLCAEDCELKSLYLYQEYYGQGLGKLLLRQAVAAARAAGYHKMYLETRHTSQRAITLYEHEGFCYTSAYGKNLSGDIFFVKDL